MSRTKKKREERDRLKKSEERVKWELGEKERKRREKAGKIMMKKLREKAEQERFNTRTVYRQQRAPASVPPTPPPPIKATDAAAAVHEHDASGDSKWDWAWAADASRAAQRPAMRGRSPSRVPGRHDTNDPSAHILKLRWKTFKRVILKD